MSATVNASSIRLIAAGDGAIRGMRACSQPNASNALRTTGGQVLK